ncbi:MAG: zinc-binding dehydrogenase [Gemmatimonadetes bacterium]|nr:zinc-binding dehydrogenase [Gemmatimonadota bacterium]
MRAFLLRRSGGPDVLQLTSQPDPVPGAGQVRVRVDAIGLNWAEVLSRKGLYGWAPKRPYIPGMEATGTIDALGAGVTGRRVGEPVIVAAQYGCYAEAVVVPERQALPVMTGFSVEENAAVAVNYATAWVALMEMARLRPSDRVLVTAAAGGVGTAAIQIASRAGCRVVGLAGSEEKLALIRELGAEAAVNYRAADFRARLREVAGAERFDVVLELVGGDVFRSAWPVLAPFGRVVVAGFASLDYAWWNPVSWLRTLRDIPRAGISALATGSHGLLATHLGYLVGDGPRLARLWADLRSFGETHGIRPVVGRTFAFEEMAAAHRYLESRASVGKIVVRVTPTT